MARIAIVLNTSWNIWNFRLPLLKRLENEGHEIIAVAPKDSYSSRIPFEYHPIGIQSRSLNPLKHLTVLLEMIRLFRKLRPDIALLYTIQPNVYGNLAARICGVRTISNIAGLGNVFIDTRFATRVAKALYKSALSHPDIVFFQNSTDMDMFVRMGLVPERNAERIPGSGVDVQRFAPREGKDSTRLPFVFLLATRLLWDKGVREFVDAAAMVSQTAPDTSFRLVGPLGSDNPTALDENDIESLIAEGVVEYAGESDCMENVIAECDCVVLPSYREGLPKILLEAAAMAKPIIATRVPGCADVVTHGVNGLLCEVRDAADLAEQMVKVLKMDEAARKLMGEAGRIRAVNEFAEAFVINQYQRAISDISGKAA